MFVDLVKKVSKLMYSQNQMIFYDYLYDNTFASEEHYNNEFIFRPLASGDYEKLSSFLADQHDSESIFKPFFDLNEAIERLHNGETCYVCETMGKIIGYSWFAKTRKYIPELGVSINLGPQELYLYNSYVSKDNRRKNVLVGNIKAPGKKFLQDGFSRVITCAMAWNKASNAAAKKLNFRIVGRLTVGYFFTLRYKINTCRHITFLDHASPFEFYVKLWNKMSKGLPSPAIQTQVQQELHEMEREYLGEIPGFQDSDSRLRETARPDFHSN